MCRCNDHFDPAFEGVFDAYLIECVLMYVPVHVKCSEAHL